MSRTLLLALLLPAAAAAQVQPESRPASQPATSQAATRPSASELRERAAGAERRGEWQAAAEAWIALTQVEPDVPDWYVAAGNALGRAGRFNDCLDLLERVRTRFPDVLEIPAMVARTYALKAQDLMRSGPRDTHVVFALEDAVRVAEDVVRRHPGHQDARLIAAQALLDLDETERAEIHAKEAIARFPKHAGGRIVLAQIAFTRFVRLRQQLLEEKPRGREEADLLAQIDAQKQAAAGALREAIALDPNRAFALTKLGDLHAWEGKVQEAMEQYQQALSVDPEAGVNHEWLRANVAADKRLAMYEKASREYLARPGAAPRKNALLEWYQGYCLFEQKEWKRARVMFEAALTHNPEFQNARHYAMLAAYWDGDHDAAARHAGAYARENARGFADLIRSTGVQEQVVPVLRYLAQRAYQASQLEDSRELNHVLAFVLDTAPEWNNYAFLCRDTGKFPESLAGYERALELEPESAQLLNDAAVILQYHLVDAENLARARGMYEKAIANAEKALRDGKLTPDDKERNETALRDARNNLAKLGR